LQLPAYLRDFLIRGNEAYTRTKKLTLCASLMVSGWLLHLNLYWTRAVKRWCLKSLNPRSHGQPQACFVPSCILQIS